MGKTTTSEFGVTDPGPRTTNAHDPSRTPGGSSTDSAAAVTSFQMPLSLGAQSGGSVIRPASYTGIYAMKPSYNAIAKAGQSVFSITYDTTGFLAHRIADLQLVAEVCSIQDDPMPEDMAFSDVSVAMIKTPMWPQAGPGTKAALEKAETILRAHHVKVEHSSLPENLNGAGALGRLQMANLSGEARIAFLAEYRLGGAGLPRELCDIAENKGDITHKERLAVYDLLSRMWPLIDEIATSFSVIIAPSAIDEAPPGIEDMGSPLFNTLWTGLHVPVINVPAFVGDNGMPMGLSVIAARNHDQHLLRVSQILADMLMGEV